MATLARVSTDRTNATTSFADVTDLQFSLAANKSYYIRFFLRQWSSLATVGARFAVNGPAGCTFKFGCWQPAGTGGTAGDSQEGVVTAYDTAFIATTADLTSATPLPVFIEGFITTTGTAGTFSLRFAAETTGTITVAAESFGIMEEVTTRDDFETVVSDVLNSSTTSVLADATGLAFAMAASKKYLIRCVVFFQTGNATTGARFAINGPASPTAVRFGSCQPQGTAQMDSGTAAAYETAIVAATTGPGTTPQMAILQGIIENGTNAGNAQIRFVAENADSTMTVLARSFGTIQEIG